jgi:hypothetical protein
LRSASRSHKGALGRRRISIARPRAGLPLAASDWMKRKTNRRINRGKGMLGSTNGTAEQRRLHRLSLLGQHEERSCLVPLDQTFHLHHPRRGAGDPRCRPIRVSGDAEKQEPFRHREAAIGSGAGVLAMVTAPLRPGQARDCRSFQLGRASAPNIPQPVQKPCAGRRRAPGHHRAKGRRSAPRNDGTANS